MKPFWRGFCIGLAIGIILTWTYALICYAQDKSWDGKDTYLRPITPNVYGPQIGSDATGKPLQHKTQDGKTLAPLDKVKPDVYGPGVGMDPYGRPVRTDQPRR